MSGPIDDLLPMFLSEAGERLERVSELLGSIGKDPEASLKVRRDLHAFKGAATMMGLGELAALCHQAEELALDDGEPSRAELVALVDRLAAAVAAMANEAEPGGAGGAPSEPPSEDPVDGPAAEGGASEARASRTEAPRAEPVRAAVPDEMRLRREELDRMADRAAQVRVVATRTRSLVEHLYQLTSLAELGLGSEAPEQLLAGVASSLRRLAIESEATQRGFERLADQQLDALLRLQVQPLRPFLLNLARHARELARSLGKQVRVEVEAGESQLDRRIIEALEEALLHLVRNAVDHGIELPAQRTRSGKPAQGEVRLEATPDGGMVRILVADDGAGIDRALVLELAHERGLVTAGQARGTEDEMLQLLLRPGFSTRTEVSTVSGRGIGMDAVADAVRRCGGDLWIESEPGHGTRVSVEVPLSRRTERILVLAVGSDRLALPSSAVRGFSRLTAEMIVRQDGRHLVRDGDRVLAPYFLSDVFESRETQAGVLVEGVAGGRPVSVVADDVLGEEEVLLTQLPSRAGAPPVFEAMTLLASGRPVAVLSLHRLVHRDTQAPSPHHERVEVRPVRVLLVDDSRVTREMVRRLLEDGGFEVVPVPEADQALRLLGEQEFDCLVTDIEMPGMGGLELTRRLRETPSLAHLPVIVVSTRDRAEDRLAGLEAGADAYLAKQSLDARELISLIERIGGRA